MIKALGYAAEHAKAPLRSIAIEREPAGPDEVEIDVLYCGVCHSDIHQVDNDWGNSLYPCVPGHEIVGRVTRVGAAVTAHAVGDIVGVGCMVDSCRSCPSCRQGAENYCEGPNSFLATYNGPMKPAKQAKTGANMYGRDNTFGGYTTAITVKADFVLKIPAGLSIERAAPILCAGITTYSPLRHWKIKAGDRVGVVGFGGLGDMAVKLARAMGAQVVVFTTHADKTGDIEALGAKAVIETDQAAMAELEASLDFILSTIPEGHAVDPFIPLLKRDGAYCAVGALAPIPGYNNMQIALGRRSLTSSSIGGVAETQDVLDFCAEHAITPDVELIAMQDVNDAFQKILGGEVRYRYVIDMATLKAATDGA